MTRCSYIISDLKKNEWMSVWRATQSRSNICGVSAGPECELAAAGAVVGLGRLPSHLEVWASCCSCSAVTACKCLCVDGQQVLSPGCGFSDKLKALHSQVGIWCYYQTWVLKYWSHIIDLPSLVNRLCFNCIHMKLRERWGTSGFSPRNFNINMPGRWRRVGSALIYMIVVCVETGLADPVVRESKA